MIPVRHTNRPFPLHPLGRTAGIKTVKEFDIKVKALRCKVLVFRDAVELRRSWRKLFGDDLGAGFDGAVQDLSTLVENFAIPGKVVRRREVDRNFFAFMALHAGNLGLDVLAHEATHAALAYVRRLGTRNVWREQPGCGSNEEALAYPVGIITYRLVEGLRRAGLLP